MAAGDPKMVYYDAAGKPVKPGDPAAVRQFLSDDPARPDAGDEEKAESGPKQFGDWSVGKSPELYFYDRLGNRVPEGDHAAVVQFAADDPRRPDAPKPFASLSVARPI